MWCFWLCTHKKTWQHEGKGLDNCRVDEGRKTSLDTFKDCVLALAFVSRLQRVLAGNTVSIKRDEATCNNSSWKDLVQGCWNYKDCHGFNEPLASKHNWKRFSREAIDWYQLLKIEYVMSAMSLSLPFAKPVLEQWLSNRILTQQECQALDLHMFKCYRAILKNTWAKVFLKWIKQCLWSNTRCKHQHFIPTAVT